MSWVNDGNKKDIKVFGNIHPDIKSVISCLYIDSYDKDKIDVYCKVNDSFYHCTVKPLSIINIVRYDPVKYIKPALDDLNDGNEYVWNKVTDEDTISILHSVIIHGKLEDYKLLAFEVIALDYFI